MGAALAVAALVALVVASMPSPRRPSPGAARPATATSRAGRHNAAPSRRPTATRALAGTSGPPRSSPAVIAAVGSTPLDVADGDRRFSASVLYPAATAGTGVTPLAAGRPWPLIVFSPGFDIDPAAYDSLLDRWVTAGFVVTVADYPGTAPDAPGGLDEADIVNHPADLRAVIDETLAQAATPGNLLAGVVNPDRIGVAGHSDGGDVTDAVISNSCCRDPRIKAAAVLSGAELTSFDGTYGPPGIPLLVVQGDADQVNFPACSEQIYDGAGPPRFYLDLHGAGHRAPYLASGPYREPVAQAQTYEQAVDQVTVLFWRAYLDGVAADATALGGGGTGATSLAPGIAGATLYAQQAVPITGSCPGAPP